MRDKIIAIVARETGLEAGGLLDDTRLDSLGLDSLEFVDLLLTVQNETGREIPDRMVASLETVADLIAACA